MSSQSFRRYNSARSLLQEHRDLVAVRRRPAVEVDHFGLLGLFVKCEAANAAPGPKAGLRWPNSCEEPKGDLAMGSEVGGLGFIPPGNEHFAQLKSGLNSSRER